MDIEIEEPTDEQRLAAVMGQAIRMAGRAAWDTQIIAYLVSQQIPKIEAQKHLPDIREQARPLMKRHFARKRLIAWLLVLIGIGIAASAFFKKDGVSIPTIILSVIPVFAGINQLSGARTPLDSELGLGE